MHNLIKLDSIYKFANLGQIGIFKSLEVLKPPWANSDLTTKTAINLDMGYIIRSGNKIIAPALERVLEDSLNVEIATDTIAGILMTMFSEKWRRVWDLLNLEYNPIENYNMKEEQNNTDTTAYGKQVNRNLTHTSEYGKQINSTVNHTLEHGEVIESADNGTVSDDGTNESKSFINAFNSENKKPTGSQDITNGNIKTIDTKNTLTHSGNDINTGVSTEKHSGTDKNTGTDVEALSGSDETTYNGKLVRSGNIGVTTTQQMMLQELEIRKNTYFDEVYKDIDSLLTLSVY